jgi:hypothetical protein
MKTLILPMALALAAAPLAAGPATAAEGDDPPAVGAPLTPADQGNSEADRTITAEIRKAVVADDELQRRQEREDHHPGRRGDAARAGRERRGEEDARRRLGAHARREARRRPARWSATPTATDPWFDSPP